MVWSVQRYIIPRQKSVVCSATRHHPSLSAPPPARSRSRRWRAPRCPGSSQRTGRRGPARVYDIGFVFCLVCLFVCLFCFLVCFFKNTPSALPPQRQPPQNTTTSQTRKKQQDDNNNNNPCIAAANLQSQPLEVGAALQHVAEQGGRARGPALRPELHPCQVHALHEAEAGWHVQDTSGENRLSSGVIVDGWERAGMCKIRVWKHRIDEWGD